MNVELWWLCISVLSILPAVSHAQEWVARYNGPGNNPDRAYAIAVDGAGNVYVTGESYGSGTDYDYATVKYATLGAEQWVARYNGPGNYHDEANAIAADNAGNIYVTGYSEGSGTGRDYATVMYDSLGVEQWVTRCNGPYNGDDEANAIAVDGACNVYITGRSEWSGIYGDYITVKYDAAGVEQWVARHDGPAYSDDEANAIAADNAGNSYVTGSDSWGINYATVAYDSAGVEQWVASYTLGYGYDVANAIVVDNAGNIYVTGESFGYGTNYDYATICYAPLGIEEDSWFFISDKANYLRVYPNPMRHNAEIRWYFSTDNNEQSTLEIFNSSGQLVKDFSNQPSTVHGCTSVRWSGDDNYGNTLPSGVYFLQLHKGGCRIAEKFLLIR